MSADKRSKSRRRRPSTTTLIADGAGQRAAELAHAARALAAQDASPTNVGESVTFATCEAPEIPVAPAASEQFASAAPGDGTRSAVGDAPGAAMGGGDENGMTGEADVATEEASVTLEQEQRERVVAEESAHDSRPTLLGLPLMSGAMSGSSNPDPQTGPETTRRQRPPRPTRPIPANDPQDDRINHRSDMAPRNGADTSSWQAMSPANTPGAQNSPDGALDEPTAPRPAAPQQPIMATDDEAQPSPTSQATTDDAPDDVASATTPDTGASVTANPAPEALASLAALTPLVSLGAVAPAAFADAALMTSDNDNDNANDDAASLPDATSSGGVPPATATTGAASAVAADAPGAGSSHDNARLQAIDLSQHALAPLNSGPGDTSASPAGPPPDPQTRQQASHPPAVAQRPNAGDPLAQWPPQPARTPNPANGPQPPVNAPAAPVMPGAPLAPLGAPYGAPPPAYQTPYPGQAGGVAQPGQPQGEADTPPSHAPWAVAASWGDSSLSGPNTAAGMSYLFWWLSGIFVYFNERQNRFVRFHAMQSILLTGALTIISVLLFTILQLFDDVATAAHQPAIAHIGLGIVIIGYALGVILPWFGAMVAAWSGTYLRIPFIGDYAERFAAPPREVYPDQPPY